MPQQAASSSSATNSFSPIPNRRAASAIGASPTWASQPTTANSRRRRRLVSAPGTPRATAAASPPSSPTNAGARVRARGAGAGAVSAPSQATSSSRKGVGWVMVAWSRRPSTQDRMAANDETLSASSTDPSSNRCTTLSWPTSSATRRASSASTRMRISIRSSPSASHGSSGRAASTSTSSGTWAPPGSPRETSPSMRSTRKVRTAARSRSHATRYQCPKRNHRPTGATRRGSPR